MNNPNLKQLEVDLSEFPAPAAAPDAQTPSETPGDNEYVDPGFVRDLKDENAELRRQLADWRELARGNEPLLFDRWQQEHDRAETAEAALAAERAAREAAQNSDEHNFNLWQQAERDQLAQCRSSDEAILSRIINECDTLDITRVSELRNGEWHATTIFDGDAALLRTFKSAMLPAAAPESCLRSQEK